MFCLFVVVVVVGLLVDGMCLSCALIFLVKYFFFFFLGRVHLYHEKKF